MPKQSTQDKALAKAFREGTLPEEDRRAAEARGVVFTPSTVAARDRGPSQSRTADEVRRGVSHAPGAPADTRTPEQIAAGVPIDTRTLPEIAAGVPAPVDDLERLLTLAEDETGYAQKQAITDLRALLGRPKLSQRTGQVLAGQARHAAAGVIHDQFAAGEITQANRDAALNDVNKRQDAALVVEHIDRVGSNPVVNPPVIPPVNPA